MRLLTIGFTQKTASKFFELLDQGGVKRIVDTRLNNVSQLAGFAKKQDLAYFLKAILGIEYEHEPLLAPTQEMLDAYKKKGLSWSDYEREYLELLRHRGVGYEGKLIVRDGDCLLCSEDRPSHCHRRLAAEYLADTFTITSIEHLY